MLQLKKSVSLANFNKPFRESLAIAAEIGAVGVEINARTELIPSQLSQTGLRQIRKWLGDHNLVISCVQFPTRRGYGNPIDLDKRIDGTKAAMNLANQLGCRVVSNRLGAIPDVGTNERSTLEAALQDLSNYSLRAGAWLAVRTGNASGEELSNLLESFPQGSLSVDFDPAELLMYHHDPESCIKPVGARVLNFRARDAVRDLGGGPSVEVQLGRGNVELAPLLASLEEHQYQGFICVDRNGASNPILECAQSMEFLDNLFS